MIQTGYSRIEHLRIVHTEILSQMKKENVNFTHVGLYSVKIILKNMLITIQLILGICINLTHASLQVTYDILNAKPGVKSYFTAATKFTSNSFVGAQCKVRRHLVCEPLLFDWFSREDYKDDLVYLMKSCVLETFEEKVTLVCLCLLKCDCVPFSHTDLVIF